MLEIRYNGYVFTIKDIDLYPNIYRTISLLSTNLEYDTFNWKVKSNAVGEQRIYTKFMEWLATVSNEGLIVDNGDFLDFVKGTPVQIYEDGVLKAEFYIQDITLSDMRDNGDEFFTVKCFSALGLLSRMTHKGDVYSGVTASTLIADIMQGIEYTIDSDVANVLLYGWLPYSTDARKNLEKVMFTLGAHIVRNANGSIRIAYNQQDEAILIPDSRIFRTAITESKERKSKIVLTEHGYFTSEFTVEEAVFDNVQEAVATQRTIRFNEPLYGYRGDGITVIDSGANWATISGVGTLYAKKYIHSQKDIIRVLDANNDYDTLSYTNQTLVSSINSNGIADRLANYYSNAKVKQIEFEVVGEKPGDLVEFSDRRTDGIIGYIRDIDETASSFWRGKAKVITNWTPLPPGNDYDSYLIVKTGTPEYSAPYWNVPEALQGKRARIVLFSGAEGGQGGWYGETMGTIHGNGSSTLRYHSDNDQTNLGNAGPTQRGGKGGAGGAGGAGATRMINIDIDSLQSRYQIAFGAGGMGGAGGTAVRDAGNNLTLTPPQNGQAGGASTLCAVNSGITYSTDDGGIFRGTYVNMITGEVIVQAGATGGSGADGGQGGVTERAIGFDTQAQMDAWQYATILKGQNGQSLYGYAGGAGANGSKGNVYRNAGGSYNLPRKDYVLVANAGGGGGGGAAMGGTGQAGSVGQIGTASVNHHDVVDWHEDLTYVNRIMEYTSGSQEGEQRITGAKGGDGGNAISIPNPAVYVGGTGGYGGGGGGGAGQCLGSLFSYSSGFADYWNGYCIGGKGGNGGQGGTGSDGFMIVYYKA